MIEIAVCSSAQTFFFFLQCKAISVPPSKTVQCKSYKTYVFYLSKDIKKEEKEGKIKEIKNKRK